VSKWLRGDASWAAVPISQLSGFPGNSAQGLRGDGNFRNAPDVQVLAAGAGQTWTKPTGAQLVRVVVIGAGGGGGGGVASGAASLRGGGGGGVGAVATAEFQASDLGA